ncbi:ZKSCAN [Mytilus coruscus]|uniref:ZKSCAN n=2 Tax=Mytilus coruscus TaxID=42192 RepID=A0A6J8D1Y2_MYTCO|nr:ZKSCAN [Mytilus coruscus]
MSDVVKTNYIYPFQCDDCGKRFPVRDSLQRHRRRSHSHEFIKCRWCPYSQPKCDGYRVKQHEKCHEKYTNLITTRNNYVCETETEEYTPEDRPISTETTRQLTEFLEASMPDFADLLGVEPRTPSPMRQLLNEEPPPECIVPSDQLFSKYLQDLSPVNSPDNFSIDIDLEPQEPSITLHNSEPSPLVSIATIIDQQQPSPSLSVATSINHKEPTEQILDLTMTRTITPCTPEDPITTNQEEPLDLSMKLKPANNLNIKPKEIPTNSLTPVIDCLVPTNLWNVKPISLETDNHEHLCLDPRLFFAGAPSQYHTHLLANTLQEKVNLCRTSQKARYKRQLVPIGVRTIMKEERCYLPDGTILEMKEVWTSDQPTPSPTEE